MTARRPPMADCSPTSVREKLAQVRHELNGSLIDREQEIALALTALIAGEHLLLVGPPGCGKSLLLDALLARTGGSKFSILLTRFTTPEEVVGPVSLSALKEDRFVRVTAGKLPETDYAFLDELFKGSSAILNTLLRMLNEGTFDRGDGVSRAVPLKLCVGASNEWPSPDTGQELSALFDRFTLRHAVSPIRSHTGRRKLLWEARDTSTPGVTLTAAQVDAARQFARRLPWSADAKEACEAVLRELAREGIRPGDRRQFKTVGVVRAFAFLNGADEVQPEHLEIARCCLWDDPQEQPLQCEQVVMKVANPPGMRVSQLLLEAEQVLATADVRNLASAATAAAKLGEIDKTLSTLTHSRAELARGHVQSELKKLKLASIAAV